MTCGIKYPGRSRQRVKAVKPIFSVISGIESYRKRATPDLNRYRQPDLSLVDASVGMADSHLGGRQCDPPVKKLIAGFDPVAVDRAAAGHLGLNWQDIGHLKQPTS